MSEIETYCAAQVKLYDYDRFLITLFAPEEARKGLFSLYAFNHEVAKIREAVSEPMLGEIRLQWWREAIEGIADNAPRNHEVVLPLNDVFHQNGLKKDDFIKIIDARSADIYDENPTTLADFETYLGATSGNLTRLAAQVIGKADDKLLTLAYDMGLVWGLIGTLRSIRYHVSLGKLSLPQELMEKYGLKKRDVFTLAEHKELQNLVEALCDSAREYLDQIKQDKNHIPKRHKSIFLLAALSRSYLNMFKKAAYNPFEINEKASMFPRQSRLFVSAMFGLI